MSRLTLLSEHFPGLPHVDGPLQGLSEWDAKGRPYVWHKQEEATLDDGRKAELLLDTSYGNMALFVEDALVGTGKKFISFDNKLIALDTEYYGLAKGLWKPA